MRSVRFIVCSLLLSLSIIAGAGEIPSAAPFQPIHDHSAFVVRNVDGQVVCTDATPAEALRITAPHKVPLRVFGEESGRVRTNASAGLNIVLRGTAQLDANPAAKAAFERAADIWESRIADQLEIIVDVDFGSTRFGDPFEEGVIASANSAGFLFNDGTYPELRTLILARANNAAETAIYNLLPTGSIPTDKGVFTRFGAGSVQLRLLTVFPAVADPNNPDETNRTPSIGFNSAFPYDFDPSNGISPGQQDFEGVVVHEIGHFLGFTSRAGTSEIGGTDAPSIMDFFRFRPGVTNGTFTNAQRILSTGGSQVFFAGGDALPLSTGNPKGENGDSNQASHWKADEQNGGLRIGIMDPTLTAGVRSELTANDLHAFGILGYNLVAPNLAPAAPSNLTATGTSTSVIRLNWTDNSNNETQFRVEKKEGANFVDIGFAEANTTQINVTNFTAGQSATFRIRARNASGDSPYSNEATGTTTSPPGSCTPNATTVCLLNNRFRVKIDYVNPFSNPPNQPGTFLAARLLQGVQNPDTGLFGFSSAQAVEVVVRIQDTRPFAPRFDVYYGGLTDVGYTVTVTDTHTGTLRQYTNSVGTVGGGVDRNSFPASALGSPDRLITSGGTDSFPAEMEPAPEPGDLVGVRYASSSYGVRTAMDVIRPSTTFVASELETRNAKSLKRLSANAGGGAACTELEPNNSILLADPLPLGEPCTGTANFGDSFEIPIDYGPQFDDGKMHDIFVVTTGATGPLTVTMTFTTASADLDVGGFIDTGDPVLTTIGNSSTAAMTETFTTTSLPAGTYYIWVSAYEGGSNYTLTVNGPAGPAVPAAPSNLAANGTSTSVIQLTWNDNSNNETEFRVERKIGASFVDIGNATANAINVTGLPASTAATFRVKARNGAGDSPYSNEATGTTQSPPGVCTPNSTTVCLLSNRFRVSIAYVNPFSNPPNQPGTFLAARLNSQAGINPDVALFGFSSAQAVEVVVRVQDTRPFAPRFDIYYGGMTDVGYTVTVTDTQTGTTRQYTNSVGTVGGGVDRNSFPAN